MKKIFEIPIYAFSKKTFSKRLDTYRKRTLEYQRTYSSTDPIKSVYDIEITERNKSVWDYNHIIGYILIYKTENTIHLKLYLARIVRYFWKSNRKVVLRDELLNGYHIYLHKGYSNKEVLEDIDRMIDEIRKKNIPDKYYVDMDAYNNIKHMIDFFSL